MAETFTLQAQKRDNTGTGDAREVRRNGRIPAIIYGGKAAESSISLDAKELFLEFQKGGFTSKVVEIEVDGKKEHVIPREVQVHPVTEKPLHADFQRIKDTDKVRVFVPVKFINHEKSPGLKRGGVLNAVRREIELLCNANAIPENLIADLNGLQVKDSLHYSKLPIPDGCEPVIQGRDFTVATIAGRLKKEETADAGAVPAADEVPTAGDEEAGDAEE